MQCKARNVLSQQAQADLLTPRDQSRTVLLKVQINNRTIMSPCVHPVANPLLLIAIFAPSDWKLVLYQKEYPLCHPTGYRLTGFKFVCKLTQHGCQIKARSIASCDQVLRA